jgi:hypothetical protein
MRYFVLWRWTNLAEGGGARCYVLHVYAQRYKEMHRDVGREGWEGLATGFFADGEFRLQTFVNRSANERAAGWPAMERFKFFTPRIALLTALLGGTLAQSKVSYYFVLCIPPPQWNHNYLPSMFVRVWPEASENQAWTFDIYQKRS